MKSVKLYGISAAVLVLAIGLWAGFRSHRASAQALPDPANPTVANCNVTTPDTLITPALLSSGLPCAVTVAPPFDLDHLQHEFDYYSWLTFIALNVPTGAPANPGSPVWEQWKDLSEVMLPGGAVPSPWGARDTPPAACQAAGAGAGADVMRMVGKLPDLLTLSPTSQPFNDGPLIDQDGKYVRYQILVNRPMFEYILEHKLYSRSGQVAFADPIVFPKGNVQQGTTGTVGAIMIKAAWKVLAASDDPTRFHTIVAFVYTPPSTTPRIAESCTKQTMALVGLHVVHKTESEPQWVWSTFEQIDNDPTSGEVSSGSLQAHYNFFDPRCGVQCVANRPPPRPWNPNIQPFPAGFKSQIERLLGTTPDVDALNSSFQGILTKPWSSYRLISTQWPTRQNPTDPTGNPAPVILANTTMETYIQGRVPQSSSSCIRCHNIAVDKASKSSDFTYILERAH